MPSHWPEIARKVFIAIRARLGKIDLMFGGTENRRKSRLFHSSYLLPLTSFLASLSLCAVTVK